MNKLPHTPQKRAQKLIYISLKGIKSKRARRRLVLGYAACQWRPCGWDVAVYPRPAICGTIQKYIRPCVWARRAVAAYASIRIPKEIS